MSVSGLMSGRSTTSVSRATRTTTPAGIFIGGRTKEPANGCNMISPSRPKFPPSRYIGSTTPVAANAASRNPGSCSIAKTENGSRFQTQSDLGVKATSTIGPPSIRCKRMLFVSRSSCRSDFPRGSTNGASNEASSINLQHSENHQASILKSLLVQLNQSNILVTSEKSGRGLRALQDPVALSAGPIIPPGFGVRAVLCRFSHLNLSFPCSRVAGRGAWSLKLLWNLRFEIWCFASACNVYAAEIQAISPPEKQFFAKRLDFHGIPIKAPAVVVDDALYAAYARLSMLLSNQPTVVSNLVGAGAELHLIG